MSAVGVATTVLAREWPRGATGPVHPINVAEYEAHAATHLPRQVYDYYRSGAHDQITLADNMNAFNRLVLRPRCLVDVSRIDMSTTVLGQRISSPICVAPTAMQRMAHPEGELATARAAASLGTLMTLSSLSTTNLTVLARSCPPDSLRWFQLYIYRDRAVTVSLVRAAEAAGFKAIALTVDTPFFGTRENDVRNGFAMPTHLSLANFEAKEHSKDIITEKAGGSGLAKYAASLFDASLTWKDIAWLRSQTTLPIVIKGVLTREDTLLAVEHGCDAILVSNHGARQVDTCAATIDALPEVVAAVNGRCEVYLDGGVRRGTDVLKALALGARAVFVGRPVLWGLAYAGEKGVKDVLTLLNKELELAMGLCGCSTVKDVTPQHVTTRDAMRPKL
jgi:(S)-2-hydroxy-acid oxidase